MSELVGRTKRLGVRLEVETEVTSVEKSDGRLWVRVSTGPTQQTFEGDLVVHGAGRVPELDDLNLAAAGVQREERGVKVNEYLQSISNSAVYAAGDAASSGLPQLTPVAAYEGGNCGLEPPEGNHRKVGHFPVPTIVFTIPPLAAVGLLEQAARERGFDFRINHENTSGWYSSRRVGEESSAFKVLIENGTDHVLGAHVIGPHADELINVFALTMQADIPTSKLREAILGYPTLGSDVKYML